LRRKSDAGEVCRHARSHIDGTALRRHTPVLIFVFTAALVTSPGQTYLLSLFVDRICADLHLTSVNLAATYGLATLLSAGALPWLGRLCDEADLLKFSLVCSTLILVGCVTAAVAQSSLVIFLGYFWLRLAGPGLLANVSATGVARYFYRDRGLILAFASLGLALGEALLPATMVASIANLGWRLSFASLGVFAWLLMLGAQLLVRRRKRLRQTSRRRLKSVNGQRHPDRVRFTIKLVGITAALTLPAAIETGLLFYQGTLARLKHLPLSTFSVAFIGYAVTQLPLSFLGGRLIDRYGSALVLILHTLPAMAGIAAFAYSDAVWGVWALLVGLSATGAVNYILRTTRLVEEYGSHRVGAARGLLSMVMTVGNAVGPPMLGAMFLWSHSVSTAFSGSLCLLVAAFAAAVLSRKQDSVHGINSR
jgi:MFS family permease